MKSETGKYNKLWNVLLHKAEEAKMELSNKPSAEIDLGMVRGLNDDNGNAIDSQLTITRSEFEVLIKDAIDDTAAMMKGILTRSSLQPEDLKFILMVGGSTYIPYVRKRIEELMGIPVNTKIDPTNAIAVGAAFFAGTKKAKSIQIEKIAPQNKQNLKIRPVYNRNSQENEEVFAAKVEGNIAGMFYRIYSEDGAFDSGLKTLATRITEDLPLREGAFNWFHFGIFDEQNNSIDVGFDTIQIAQGCYSVAGQMLPDDISLVLDDLSNKDTWLDKVFAKNCVLPTKTKMTKEVGKTIIKGSNDAVSIMIVEGPCENHSLANKPIGILIVTGKQIKRDLLKGTEIDLNFEMSESRDLTVSAYLNGTGQEFSEVFHGKHREVSSRTLASEVIQLESIIQNEIDDAITNDNKEIAELLDKLQAQTIGLIAESAALSDDDVTDDRYKLEDKKRRIAQEVFQLTSSKRLDAAKIKYRHTKHSVFALVQDSGTDREMHQVQEIFALEQVFIHSTNPERIQTATSDLERIRFQILMRTPDFLVGMFEHLVERSISMNDQVQAKQLIENGKQLIKKEEWDGLRIVNGRLWDLMPDSDRNSDDMRLYTGIV